MRKDVRDLFEPGIRKHAPAVLLNTLRVLCLLMKWLSPDEYEKIKQSRAFANTHLRCFSCPADILFAHVLALAK